MRYRGLFVMVGLLALVLWSAEVPSFGQRGGRGGGRGGGIYLTGNTEAGTPGAILSPLPREIVRAMLLLRVSRAGEYSLGIQARPVAIPI